MRFDHFNSTLHITTRSIAPWTVTGPKQAAVVKYLVEQFENGRQRVSAGDILVAAHGSREAARGKRVPSIFSGNSQWLDYIEHDDAGYGPCLVFSKSVNAQSWELAIAQTSTRNNFFRYRINYLIGDRSDPVPHATNPVPYDQGRRAFRERFVTA